MFKSELFKKLLDDNNEIELRYGAFTPGERSWSNALSILNENPDIETITLMGTYVTDRYDRAYALAKGFQYEHGITEQPARLLMVWKMKKGKWLFRRMSKG